MPSRTARVFGYRYGPRYSKFGLIGKVRLIRKGAASTIKMLRQLAKIINRIGFPVNRYWSSPKCWKFILLISLVSLASNCRMNQTPETPTVPPSQTTTNSNDPQTIHRRAITVDMHADTTQRMIDENVDLMQRLPDGHFDSVRAREGGLDAQFFSIWVEPQLFGGGGAGAMKRADVQLAAVRRLVEQHPDAWEFANSAADIRRIAAEGKLAALAGLEGGYAIDEKLENVERYFKLGVRYMSPAWSVSTTWAGSSGDVEGKTRGLNDFGKQVVREMNKLGMMVDVSHVSDPTFWDIVNTSSKPVIATHSGCRAIANVPRNLTDDMIRALAKTGGVVNVIFYPEHIEPGWSEKKKRVDAEIAPMVQRASQEEKGGVAQKKIARDEVRRVEYAKRLPPVSVSRLVDHIDHIVKLVGIDHIGIGSDFDGVQSTLSDLADVSQLPSLTNELLRRGYTATDVEKILGGNMLRVMEAQ